MNRSLVPPIAYRPSRWLPGGHLQTLYAALLCPRPSVRLQRTRWDTPDGDFVDLDWLDAPGTGPLIVLFHGLEGCSRSHYAQALLFEAERWGWRGVVAHFRGCSGELNRRPRAYHSGDTEHVDWVLHRLKNQEPGAPLFALGVSLGGNALLKWLGERGPSARSVVRAAAAASVPFDLAAAGRRLAKGFNRVYTRHFLRSLKRKSLEKLERFPGLYPADRVRRARTFEAFDDVVTAPLHGFRDADDYWARASSKPHLARIAVPTLIVHARDDPFLPQWAVPRPAEVSPAVTLEVLATGGHAGFVCGPFPGHLQWLPRRMLGFFAGHAPVEPAGRVGVTSREDAPLP